LHGRVVVGNVQADDDIELSRREMNCTAGWCVVTGGVSSASRGDGAAVIEIRWIADETPWLAASHLLETKRGGASGNA